MSKPITAAELVARGPSLPDFVYNIVNTLLEEKFDGEAARIVQDEIVARICASQGCKRQDVCDNGWLNFETAYRNAGWSVTYDSPGYNESYPAFFYFMPKSR